MIITRTPFRISFFGGGTDYANWYANHGGKILSSTINKYCYINIRYLPPFFDKRSRIVWSQIETVNFPHEIQHPVVRAGLEYLGIEAGVEVHHDGDLPARSGLGSSSAFTVGFTLLTNTFLGKFMSKLQLAETACFFEIEELHDPIGKQDSYASTFGGLNRYDFNCDGSVEVLNSNLSKSSLEELQKCIFLVRVGGYRKTSDLLMLQIKQYNEQSNQLATYQKMADQARWASQLEEFNPYEFGEALNQAWSYKKSLGSSISNVMVEELITKGLSSGATGAKLLGAGGSGFVLFIVPRENQERFLASTDIALVINPLFDFEGAKVVYP
jgi:D-glycero-alpha-D-manno-heptose-7-phosphate kinase